MTEESDAEILSKIQDEYIPFLNKLIGFLMKKKDTSAKIEKLTPILDVFSKGDISEKIKAFYLNRKQLENWILKYQRQKRNHSAEETDSSQDSELPPSKKAKSAKNSKSSYESGSNALNDMDIIPISQIKKEKEDSNTSPKLNNLNANVSIKNSPTVHTFASSNRQIKKQLTTAPAIANESIQPQVLVDPPPSKTQNANSKESDKPILFRCASCQFQTYVDSEFMKHARTDHRTDLSMWCKKCGRCFSNAGVLVTHIKEQNCVKENMIYRCGVKLCTFETTSGQTFVHHLRHCHKGSPFIFCVHCQKIFTLPHCLILHMQDDCPLKEKNRIDGQIKESEAEKETPQALALEQLSKVQARSRSTVPIQPPKLLVDSEIAETPSLSTSKARGKSKVRGRIRMRDHSDSSETDSDPDDPSWQPEESTNTTCLRRSVRWAKRISDAHNPDSTCNGPERKKSFTSADVNEKSLLSCPCCDFMAAIKSVLEDHYIAIHKTSTKIACLECHVKFENMQLFIDHFEKHSKVKSQDTDASEENSNQNFKDNTLILSIEDGLDGMVENISPANLDNLSPDNAKFIKIPYQASIHEKNQKDTKLKKFEQLKSSKDLIIMKKEENLKYFYKCVIYNCPYFSDDHDDFMTHLDTSHNGQRLHCGYCLKELILGKNLVFHMLREHSKRRYQCCYCFYRAFSKAHVQIHLENAHAAENDKRVIICNQIAIPSYIPTKEISTPDIKTTWPFICTNDECKFQTYDPKEYKKHHEIVHRISSTYICFYCKVDFVSFRRLMNHYSLHGINTYQCTYCIHGAETKNEILSHLSHSHADFPLKAHIRTGDKNATSENESETIKNEERSTIIEAKNSGEIEEQVSCKSLKNKVKTDSQIELYSKNDEKCYPHRVKNIISDFFCGIPFCKEKFDDMIAYFKHLKNVHFSLNFFCPHCPNYYDESEKFKIHLMCHSSNLYSCTHEKCDYYTWNTDEISQHIKTNHPLNTAKKYVIREYLQDSKEIINEIKALPYAILSFSNYAFFECIFCHYKSTNMGIMKNHLYKELAYTRFVCKICNKRFVSRKDIKDHYNIEHTQIDILCKIENNPEIEFLVKKLLNQKPLTNQNLNYTCNNCFSTFTQINDWHNHLYFCLHQKYEPYECNHCNKSFSTLRLLKFHTDEEHYPNPVKYSTFSSVLIEDEIGKQFHIFRSKFLKEIFKDLLNDQFSKSEMKFYKCSVCNYKANFRINIDNHINKNDCKGTIEKISHDFNNDESLLPAINENVSTAEVLTLESYEKKYRCGYCLKTVTVLQELVGHIESFHLIKDGEYSYFYWPDIKSECLIENKETYECGYCKISNNLHELKKHCELLHPEMDFKVRGYFYHNTDETRNVACGYCYKRLPYLDIKNHIEAEHPNEEIKYYDDFQDTRLKRLSEEDNDVPYKQINIEGNIRICLHCGGAFSSIEQVIAHTKRYHSRLSLKFDERSEDQIKSDDVLFYKCKFCAFISEKIYLDKHLSTKHKMRVRCNYCHKQFEFATRLKEHHDAIHQGLPLKYNKENINSTSKSCLNTPNSFKTPSNKKDQISSNIQPNDKSSNNKEDKLSNTIQEGISHYGKSPEPVDLKALTVNINTREGGIAKITVNDLFQMFSLCPKVIVQDYRKTPLD